MKAVLDILRQWQPGIEVATLIAVIIYVWKTWSMAREMKLSREKESKPNVVCCFEHNKKHKNAYDLIIKNFGRSMASNVKLAFSLDLPADALQHHLTEKTFKAMAPGYEWRTLWDSFLCYDPSAPDEFIAKVSYQWGPHKKLEEYDVSFDIKSLMGMKWPHGTTIEDSVDAIAESIRKIRLYSTICGCFSPRCKEIDDDAKEKRTGRAPQKARLRYEEIRRKMAGLRRLG